VEEANTNREGVGPDSGREKADRARERGREWSIVVKPLNVIGAGNTCTSVQLSTGTVRRASGSRSKSRLRVEVNKGNGRGESQ
jgi:hypothetical protein